LEIGLSFEIYCHKIDNGFKNIFSLDIQDYILENVFFPLSLFLNYIIQHACPFFYSPSHTLFYLHLPIVIKIIIKIVSVLKEEGKMKNRTEAVSLLALNCKQYKDFLERKKSSQKRNLQSSKGNDERKEVPSLDRKHQVASPGNLKFI
jgi:hypothetical protein